MVSEVEEDSGSIPSVPKWRVLRKSHFKVNQELNELKMKANELEKLFAEHKLRVSGEQPLTSCSNMSKLSTVAPQVEVLNDQDQGDATTHNFSPIGLSDYARGKFYESYMQKRDVKLREEWGSKKEEKEAKMKAMEDSLEQSAAEMKAKFSGSIQRRAERSRSFNASSTVKIEENKDEEDLSFKNGVSKSPEAKKPPNKNLPSSIPRSSAAPVPKSSKNTRTMQPENPLVHSVPSLSDLRKEILKPNSGVSKTITRPPTKIHACSKSSIEHIIVVKEEKKPHSQSQRKSTVVPTELGIVLTPSKHDKSDKLSKNAESKPFRGKGSGVGPGTGALIAKMKGSVESKNMNYEVESDESVSSPKELHDMGENEEEEESETTISEDRVNVDNVKPRLSHENENLVDSGSDGADTSRSFSRVEETSSVAELTSSMPSTFHPVGSEQHSHVQSPLSWNSCVQHAFSYAHETSDIDASPVGSIASWNSLSLSQAETGAARVRKKWGSTQKPNLVSNSSHGHSRKDVTSGFKRLLHLGRKSHGTDNLVDWISAATSEGNDYTRGHPTDYRFNESEYFREQGSQREVKVQVLRSSIATPTVKSKSRDHHLSGSSIKASKSLFSLSSFRSKGSDSKPR